MCELKKKSNKMLIMKVENKLRANSEKNKRFFLIYMILIYFYEFKKI